LFSDGNSQKKPKSQKKKRSRRSNQGRSNGRKKAAERGDGQPGISLCGGGGGWGGLFGVSRSEGVGSRSYPKESSTAQLEESPLEKKLDQSAAIKQTGKGVRGSKGSRLVTKEEKKKPPGTRQEERNTAPFPEGREATAGRHAYRELEKESSGKVYKKKGGQHRCPSSPLRYKDGWWAFTRKIEPRPLKKS